MVKFSPRPVDMEVEVSQPGYLEQLGGMFSGVSPSRQTLKYGAGAAGLLGTGAAIGLLSNPNVRQALRDMPANQKQNVIKALQNNNVRENVISLIGKPFELYRYLKSIAMDPEAALKSGAMYLPEGKLAKSKREDEEKFAKSKREAQDRMERNMAIRQANEFKDARQMEEDRAKALNAIM
jgi:hypothetical protein